jgi:cytochrome c oxidase subunit 4
MSGRIHRLVLLWLLLILLGATAFGGTFLPLPHTWRVLLLLPSIVMALVVAIGIMEIRRSGTLAMAFAVAGLFWLGVLLSLGAMDPLTRQVYPVGLTIPG